MSSLFSNFEVKRVRSNVLPVGDEYHLLLPMWVSRSTHNVHIGPAGKWDGSGRLLNDQKMFASDRAYTGDIPRKYKDKIALSFPGNRTIRLWKYLPFYKLNYKTRIKNAPPEQGRLLPCMPANSEILSCYATTNNKWQSSLPTSFPLRDEFAYNPYGSYGEVSPKNGSTEEFFQWCESLNLSLLVKRGLAALESCMTNFPDMLVVLGELRELPDLFKLPTSAGDAYLQNQFGFSPTIGSIVDVGVGIAHRWNEAFGPKRLVVHMPIKGDVVKTDSAVPTRNSCCWGGNELCPQGGRNTTIIEDTGLVSLELTYAYVPPDWGSAVLNKLDEWLTAWNLVGDASTLWELTRMSWMVDWFLPIGDILKGASAFAGTGKWSRLHVYMGYISFRRIRTRTYRSNMYVCQAGETSVSHEEDEYVRIPLLNPWSWLSLSLDSSSAPHTLSQLLTVAALAKK